MSAAGTDTRMMPIALGDGFALLHHGPASRSTATGVVLCSAWGLHELGSRKLLFGIARRLASVGLPAIRFDYPGTADALARPSGGLEGWIAAALDAADTLKNACAVNRIIFAGVGLGATVALLAGRQRRDVDGFVLAAPVVSGRRYVREIALASNVVDEGLGLQLAQRPEGVSIGGIVMPPEVEADLRTLDLAKNDLDTHVPILFAARPNHPQELALADRLVECGASVERVEFARFEDVMDNPTLAIQPEELMEAITHWCAGLAHPAAKASLPAPSSEPVLASAGAHDQEPLTFDHGLFGVLTHPAHRSSAPIVVFLNSGYDHHAGWAYQSARAAQLLADQGVASFRFDMGNIGDSSLRPGAAAQVLYDAGQLTDIAAALDMLEARGEASVILVGRCSGAYAALHASSRDPRVAGGIYINPLRFIWDPDENIDVVLRAGPRTMATYRRLATSGRTFKRLMSGDINIPAAARSIVTLFLRGAASKLAPLLSRSAKSTRMRRACRAMMEAMSRRGMPMHFVFSEGDDSIDQMAFYFGEDLSGLDRYPNVVVTRLENADHNMTPLPAQEAVVAVVRDLALGTAATMPSTPSSEEYALRVDNQQAKA